MADEATLTIVLQEKGGAISASPPQSPRTPATAPPGSPAALFLNSIAPQAPTPAPRPVSAGSPAFDATAEALKRLAAKQKELEIQEKLAELTQGPNPAPQFDPVAEANRLWKAEQQRLQVAEELDKLRGPKPGFDPVADAKALLALEEKRLRVKAALADLRGDSNEVLPGGPQPFDAATSAREMIAKEEQRLLERQQQRQAEAVARAQRPDLFPRPGIVGRVGEFAENSGFGRIGQFLQKADKFFQRTPQVASPQASGAAPTTLPAAGSATGGAANAATGGEAAAGGEVATGAAEAGGALAGLAAVAAPVAIGLLVAEGAAKLVAGAFNFASENVRKMGQVAVDLAQNNNLEGLLKGADAAAEFLGKIPIVGQAWEAEIKLATTTIRTFNAVVDAFIKRGQELAQYSGPLTAANAQADIRTLLGDIREANYLGDSLARLTEAQSDATAELREILLPIKRILVEHLAGVLETATGFMELAEPLIDQGVEYLRELLETTYEVARATGGPLVQAALELVIMARDEYQRRKAEKAQDQLGMLDRQINDLMNQLPSFVQVQPDPILQAAGQSLNIPALAF